MVFPIMVVLLLLPLVPFAAAGTVQVADREASYPAEVTNITHAPWAPARGEDVRVTLRLADGAAPPDGVALLYCRVEPEYICGLPEMMERDADGRVWTGTVRWSDFMEPETQHVGYNLTLRYEDDAGATARVTAPLGNFWAPDTYPSDSEGHYYFLSYGETESSPGPAWPLLFLLLSVVVATRRMRRG